MALLLPDAQTNSKFKERIIKKLVLRIENDNNSVDVHFFLGKSSFRRELKDQTSTRIGTPLRATDFEFDAFTNS